MALPNARRTSSGNVRRASRAAGWNFASFTRSSVPDPRLSGIFTVDTTDGTLALVATTDTCAFPFSRGWPFRPNKRSDSRHGVFADPVQAGVA
ncbi:MAG: hypothetical protein K0R38_6310 [Polyangiaceae bacterium]|nr:hypothetical protein [Polyangiaceae bacterium]